MPEWMRFAFIVLVIAIDDVLSEVRASTIAVWEFIKYRIRWIVVEKWRSLRRGV
jgi:hypothetical protein